MLLLVIAGCSHYEEKEPEVQIGTTFFYNPDKKIVPNYPFPLLVAPLELDDCVQKGRWQQGNCGFKLLSAQWLYFHQQQILADNIINDVIKDGGCELGHEQAKWWKAWSDQQKTYWNSSMLILSDIAQNPAEKLYPHAYSSIKYAYDKRNTSANSLSVHEQQIIESFEKYSAWMEEAPSKEAFEKAKSLKHAAAFINEKYENPQNFERLLICYDHEVSDIFVTQIFEEFQRQQIIKELYLLSIHDDPDLIEELLSQQGKRTFLISYNLETPVVKEWIRAAAASLTLGPDFYPQRSQDYHLANFSFQFLSQLEQGPYLLKPQVVIYDQEHEELLEHPLIQSIPYRLKIATTDYQDALIGLLALPQRQSFFQPYLKNAVYINQPRALPYNVLLLLEPSLLRLSYPFLRYWQQERALMLAPPGSLTGIDTLDSSLKGIITTASPRTRAPKQITDAMEAQDLLALSLRWPWMQYYQGYIYEGKLGRYRLKEQELLCEWDMVVYQADKE